MDVTRLNNCTHTYLFEEHEVSIRICQVNVSKMLLYDGVQRRAHDIKFAITGQQL